MIPDPQSLHIHIHLFTRVFNAFDRNSNMTILCLTMMLTQSQIDEAAVVQSLGLCPPDILLGFLAEVFTSVKFKHNMGHKFKRGPTCPKRQSSVGRPGVCSRENFEIM